ncbi:MAG: hypothetical protein JKX67_05345 [Colwellia sp.]|nr:hypothetical protein [Colwellia sp.]
MVKVIQRDITQEQAQQKAQLFSDKITNPTTKPILIGKAFVAIGKTIASNIVNLTHSKATG